MWGTNLEWVIPNFSLKILSLQTQATYSRGGEIQSSCSLVCLALHIVSRIDGEIDDTLPTLKREVGIPETGIVAAIPRRVACDVQAASLHGPSITQSCLQ